MLYDFKQTSRQKRGWPAKTSWLFPFLLTTSFLILFIPTLKETILSPCSHFDQLKREVLEHPCRPQAHLRLAQFYFQTNNLEGAKKELDLVLSLNPNCQEAKDLGVQIKDQEGEPERIKAKIQDWEKILAEKPGYRDAHFQIAVLSWQIYQEEEAREATDKALELDPNFKAAKNFKRLLSK